MEQPAELARGVSAECNAGVTFYRRTRMILQNDPELLAYVNAKTHRLAPKVGGFLEVLFQACYRADRNNYPLIRPALIAFFSKYPAEPELLAAELADVLA